MLTLAAALLFSPVSTPVELASAPAALHGTLLTPDGPTRAAGDKNDLIADIHENDSQQGKQPQP